MANHEHQESARRAPRRLAVLFALALSGRLGLASAAPVETAPPSFPTSAAKVQKVVEEVSYYYRIMDYQPFVTVKPVTRVAARYDSPEATTIAAVSAMLAGDYAWWRSTWSPAAQRTMDERDREQKRGPEHWRELWSKALAGKTVEITRRIETGPYVLVAYRLLPGPGAAADAKPSAEISTAFVRDGEKWLATQDLTGDPVLSYWDQPDYRVKKLGRGLPN